MTAQSQSPTLSRRESFSKKGIKPAKNGQKHDQDHVSCCAPRTAARMFVERSIVVLTIICQLVYLTWRWQRFLTSESTYWISVPFIVSETLIVFCGSFITYFLIWFQSSRENMRLSTMDIPVSEYPTVDIMIPCYNEPVEIVRLTTLAALNIDYPSEKITINICDDGNSPAMRSLIAQIRADMRNETKAEIRYIARKKTKGVPHHAKAGNINNALFNEPTNGDYIVIFDCDMICKPEFLQAVIPHFYKKTEQKSVEAGASSWVIDDNCAMVQTPQSFINVEESDPLGQQYRYFYGPVLKGWDAAGSCPCCGTNVTFSRAALTKIGGFTYGSITEDFLTSMTLHDNKFDTKYVHEYLATGLATETVHDFYKQRFRWSAGGLQIFLKNNALFKSGLTITQKFLYFWAGFNTMLSIPMIYLMFCPIIFLLSTAFTDKISVATFDTYEYFIFFMPYMTLQLCCMAISYRDVPKIYLVRSLQESIFMIFCYARAVLTTVFGLELAFKVTSKEGASEFRKSFNWVIPMLVYYVLGAAAIAMGVLKIMEPYTELKSQIAVGVSVFWISFIMWQMWPPIGFLLRQTNESFDVEESPSPANKTNESTVTTADVVPQEQQA